MAARTGSWWGDGCITEHFRGVSILLRAAGVHEGDVACPCRHANALGHSLARDGFYTAGPHTDGWPWLVLRLCPSCARNAESEFTVGHGAEMGLMVEHPQPTSFNKWVYRRVSWEQAANVKAILGSAPEAYYQGPANEDRLNAMAAQFNTNAALTGRSNALDTRTELDLMGTELRQRITQPGVIKADIA